MIIKTIAVTYGRKFNLGNYESLNIEVSAWADLRTEPVINPHTGELLEVPDDVGEAYKVLFLELRTQVKEYYLKAKGIKAAPVQDMAPGTAFGRDSVAAFQTSEGGSA